ncbi:MAG: M48 family metallopeptidase [Alphaproteobacteria bacterium]|nr:M48 family metallopeptidase [Alphaproteobacteria bacterium]
MRRLLLTLFAAALPLAVGCSKAPVTGRKQYNLLPDSLMLPLAKSSYQDTLSKEKKVKNGTDATLLREVGQRIATVADQPKYDWEFTLVDDEETINAWCMPGGKIAFYTGILPVLKHEAGMSFVMGHEVGHATAHHGAERLSQNLSLVGGLAGLYLFLDKKTELKTEQKATIVAALGAGAAVGVILPFSRAHEREADAIGVMYMARAGYDPDESLGLWDRMEELSGGSKVPVFLSTHPSHEKRKEKLKEWLPKARKKYERSKLSGDRSKTLWGKEAAAPSTGGGAVLGR